MARSLTHLERARPHGRVLVIGVRGLAIVVVALGLVTRRPGVVVLALVAAVVLWQLGGRS